MLVLFYLYIHHSYPLIIYILKRGLLNMVVKINSKPIKVTEENEEDQPKGWLYVVVCGIGYIYVLLCWIMYVLHFYLFIPFLFFLGWVGG
jgi:hypothetical protein